MAVPPTSTGFARKRSRANVGAAAIALAVSLIAPLVHGAGTGLPGVEPKLLPPEQAFRFSARALDPQTLDVGVCYPPTAQQVRIALPAAGTGPGPVVDAVPQKKGWFR